MLQQRPYIEGMTTTTTNEINTTTTTTPLQCQFGGTIASTNDDFCHADVIMATSQVVNVLNLNFELQ
jgi:hypothetical protein